MIERTYRIHIAAEMSGVSEGLIRAWERRYGVLKPRRTASGYRSYTEADIEILKRLKKLTAEGVAIAEAVGLLPQIKREVREQSAESPVLRRVPQPEQVVAWRDGVMAAAERLDQGAVEKILDEASASLPPVAFFDELLAPVQRLVGDRWHQGTLSVAEEHLVTQAARQRLLSLLHGAPRRARFHVVCACLPDEDHELGLLGAALRFRHAGWRVTFLGARTPAEHLGRVVRSTRPDLVAISAVGDPGDRELRATLRQELAALPEGTRVALGGAAADRHPELLKELRVEHAKTPQEWAALLG